MHNEPAIRGANKNDMKLRSFRILVGLVLAVNLGCSEPLTTREKGAAIGTLGGAAVGGIVGSAVGHPGVGAALAARGRSPIFTKCPGSARSGDLGAQIVSDRVLGSE